MKQTLSGNSLFHFTNSFDNIIGILKNGFYPRLCFEEGIVDKPLDQLPDTLIPMVCFCDMRVSDADKGRHTSDYGNYAIGVTKDWARTYGICPVLYSWPWTNNSNNKLSFAHTERAMGLIFGNMLKELEISKKNGSARSLMNIRTGLGTLLFFTKKYEGYLYKNLLRGDHLIRFYDEREWRYVPVVIDVDGKNEFIYDILTSYVINAAGMFHSPDPIDVEIGNDTVKISKQKYLELQNEQLIAQSLTLSGSDVSYIIVEKRDDINRMKKELAKLKNIKAHANSISIVSFEDIRNDY